MNNAYLKNPEDEWDIRWYLIEGGILESIQYGTYESFKKKLWDVLVILTSQNNTGETKEEYIIEHLDDIILMIKGCHYFLHHKKRLKYEEDWIDIRWLPNPYRCLEKYRTRYDEKLNYHLAHFDYNFTQLTREEIQNFVVAFEGFFSEMDLSSWLNLLDDWKRCVNENESIFESGGDYTPLKTFEKLLKLREACYVAYHWAAIEYPPPNKHLYVDFLHTEYHSYKDANPLESIQSVLYEVNYHDFREDILLLYSGYSFHEMESQMDVITLRHNLRWLLNTAWLLLQTDYFPEDWLSPDKIDFLRCPMAENEVSYWRPKTLDFEESDNLAQTLSKVFHHVDLQDEIYQIDNRIILFLENTNNRIILEEYEFKTKDRLLKILDIFTVINLDIHSRRTKLEGIIYKSSKSDNKSDSNKVKNDNGFNT